MITLTAVSKIYTIGGEEVRALDHATMHVGKGEFVSIIGPSGTGKSTLINIIRCLDVADSGEYLLDGLAIEKYKEKELTAIRNKKIGFIFQNFNLIGKLTAEEFAKRQKEDRDYWSDQAAKAAEYELSPYDKKLPRTDRQRIQKEKMRWDVANSLGDFETRKTAHKMAETIRARYGYSGGAAGDQRIRGSGNPGGYYGEGQTERHNLCPGYHNDRIGAVSRPFRKGELHGCDGVPAGAEGGTPSRRGPCGSGAGCPGGYEHGHGGRPDGERV